jgi:hypothetical protein
VEEGKHQCSDVSCESVGVARRGRVTVGVCRSARLSYVSETIAAACTLTGVRVVKF